MKSYKWLFNLGSFSALALLMFLVSGCASILSDSQYPVTINCNPSGAKVVVRNEKGVVIHQATTPATLSLKASAGFFNAESYSFEFEKEGYYSGSSSLSAGLDPWYIGNILFGGLIGILIVDPATGAMWKLDDMVYGNLSPNPNFKATQPVTSVLDKAISEKLDDLKGLMNSGVLTEDEYKKKKALLLEQL